MAERNTTKSGTVRFLIFKEDDVWYGVAFEFGIVTEATSQQEAYANLLDATQGYLESLRASKYRPTQANPLLNKKADEEYEKLWDDYHAKKPIESPITISSAGTLAVN